MLTCILLMSGRLKIFCRSRTVAPSSICGCVAAAEPARVVGVDDQAVAGGDELAVLDLLLELRLLGLLQLPGRLLGQLVGLGLLDLALELLDRLVLGVLLEHVQLGLGLLEGELGLLLRRAGRRCSGRARRSPSRTSGRTSRAGPRPASGRTRPGRSRPGRSRMSCLKMPSIVLLDGDLGDLAGELGVLVGGLGPLGGDLLVDQLVLQGRAESSSQTSSPFLTRVPSGTIMMIVVWPSTWQKTSSFSELSRLPRSLTIDRQVGRPDLVGDDVDCRRRRTGRLERLARPPGTPSRRPPATTPTTTSDEADQPYARPTSPAAAGPLQLRQVPRRGRRRRRRPPPTGLAGKSSWKASHSSKGKVPRSR